MPRTICRQLQCTFREHCVLFTRTRAQCIDMLHFAPSTYSYLTWYVTSSSAVEQSFGNVLLIFRHTSTDIEISRLHVAIARNFEITSETLGELRMSWSLAAWGWNSGQSSPTSTKDFKKFVVIRVAGDEKSEAGLSKYRSSLSRIKSTVRRNSLMFTRRSLSGKHQHKWEEISFG